MKFIAKFVSTLVVLLVCAATLWLIWPSPFAAEDVLQVRSSSGAKLRSLLTGDPATAKANIILLTGGDGVLKISGKGQIKNPTTNFLVRTRQLFASAGFLTAVVDAPMDKRGKPGLLGGFRASAEHGRDLAKVVKKLSALNNKPVIVIGTSRGTVSAANVALKDNSGAIKAVVLTAALVKANKRGAIITDLPLGKLAVPVLFVHNSGDKCKTTPLGRVKTVVNRLKKQGVKTDLIVVSSSKKNGGHCDGTSPHGFFGLEEKVINKIVNWFRPLL